MPRVTTASLGSDPVITEASVATLVKGGTSVDACIAGFFAAAGTNSGVLLGSTVLLVGGTGVGAHVFDGSVLQPGKGAPRPRGYIENEDIPVGSRIPVATVGALLAAAHAHGGSISMSELATAGVRIARAAKAPGRANLLRRVGSAGPVALRESSFVRAMLAIAGRAEGGNITPEDLNDAKARVVQPLVDGDLVSIETPVDRIPCPPVDTTTVVACDHQGVLAVLHTTFDPHGVELVDHQVTASKMAVPVLRGVPRIRPGVALCVPVPIVLLTERGTPWAAVALDGISPVDWDRLAKGIGPGITLEQALQDLLTGAGPGRRALAVVCGSGPSASPRATVVTST